MKSKKLIRLIAILSGLVLLMCACSSKDSSIRFGTAGIGGNYHSFAQAFAQTLHSDHEDMNVVVKVTEGSAANLRLISGDFIRLALTQTDTASDAWSGTGVFEETGALTGYSAVAGLYMEACQIVVLADSDIQNVNDLMNRTISVGEAESGTEQNADQILLAYGLNDKLTKQVNLSYTEAAKALTEGEIDAMFCTAGVKTTVISELTSSHPVRLLPIEGKEADALLTTYDFYSSYIIPAGEYPGMEEDVRTLGVKSMLIASDKLSEETVKNIAESLFNHSGDLQLAIPVDFELTEDFATSDIPIPFHKGAAAYYESKGISLPSGKE